MIKTFVNIFFEIRLSRVLDEGWKIKDLHSAVADMKGTLKIWVGQMAKRKLFSRWDCPGKQRLVS